MSLYFKGIETLNEEVYNQLNGILKMLDTKWNLKFYSIELDGNESCKKIIRVKKTLSLNKMIETKISEDILNELKLVFDELGLDVTFSEKEIRTKFKEYCNQQKFLNLKNNLNVNLNESQNNQELSNGEEVNNTSSYIHEDNSRILYCNSFDNGIGTVNYIIEIRNVDFETINLFYKFPDLSFLRMVLDWFFMDYFVENQNDMLNKGENNTINTKYNEDSIQFNRRITRLYFGKLQGILLEKSSLNEIPLKFDNDLSNHYYINDMLEKIDSISSHTYEGSSPFGSILFLNSGLLKSKNNPIDYTIKFQFDDLIALNDAKLIRKLLELTNIEKDLYLISDHEMIYGLGKISWNKLNEFILIRIDFTGLSKYSVNLITTKDFESSEGELVRESGKKIYRISRDLEVVEKNLIKVSFKSPIIGGDGFTSDKFKRLLKSEYSNEEYRIKEEVIEYLEKVVISAKEQKHGTMVVITDYKTAVSELKKLKKQSILIESAEIIPEYIKYLTSIDGAIYFDTNGMCHAIGVILDGIANENIGDVSRGARYNSAYRYLEKIKESNKKCVIVIISEDGMVNLIPETYNEEKIYALLQQLIDLINNQQLGSELEKIEEMFLNNNNIDYHLFFKVAEVYHGKNNFEKAIEYYEKGLKVSGRNIILVENYRFLGKLFFDAAHEANKKDDYTSRIYYLEEADKIYDKYVIKANENDLNLHDYNDSAITYNYLGNSTELKREVYYQKSFHNFSKAIELSQPNAILFSNRSLLLLDMGKIKEALEDLINAEFITSSEDYINRIMNLIQVDGGLVNNCIQIIQDKNENDLNGEKLIEKLKQYGDSIKDKNPEVAVSFEKL